jgi:hypothetical protein
MDAFNMSKKRPNKFFIAALPVLLLVLVQNLVRKTRQTFLFRTIRGFSA